MRDARRLPSFLHRIDKKKGASTRGSGGAQKATHNPAEGWECGVVAIA